MTEASYTAWDDNEYSWPPPEGWYRSADGKWWPEGYGPPEAVSPEERLEANLALEELEPEAPAPQDSTVGMPDEVTDEPVEATEVPVIGEPIEAKEPNEANEPDTRSQAGAGHPVYREVVDGAVDHTSSGASALDAPGPDRPSLFNGRAADPASSNGQAMEGKLFDTDRATSGDTVYSPPPVGPPLTEPQAGPAAESAPATITIASNEAALDFANAEAVSIPDSQEILDAAPKGPSRGLWLALAGAIALVAIGVAVYLALGGDEEPAETVTPVAVGPGSIDEPHPRASGVVVFYPDGDTDQRWLVEVLEPVRDATDELGGSDGVTLVATRLRIRNQSGAELASVGDLRFNVVGESAAVTVRTDNQCPAAADDLNFDASVPVGSTVEGTVCWAIPVGSQSENGAILNGLKLGIESPKVQGRIHIALQ